MNYTKLTTAQYIIPRASSQAMAGFNSKVYGDSYTNTFSGYQSSSQLHSGWSYAETLINDGKIYYTHNFHNRECDSKGHAFQYGGFWVCNECGKRGVDKQYWNIKVYKDGDEFCCVGEGFENLQESSNYAFGKTKQEAIYAYHSIYFKGSM